MSMTDDKYGARLRHIYEFCWRVAAGSGKSADIILHREPPLLKHRSDATGHFKTKNKFSLDMIYDLKG
jgi:hypothetical protein